MAATPASKPASTESTNADSSSSSKANFDESRLTDKLEQMKLCDERDSSSSVASVQEGDKKKAEAQKVRDSIT